jgi:hypothetical protein
MSSKEKLPKYFLPVGCTSRAGFLEIGCARRQGPWQRGTPNENFLFSFHFDGFVEK